MNPPWPPKPQRPKRKPGSESLCPLFQNSVPMNVNISIKDKLTPALRRELRAMQNPRPVASAMGKALEKEHIAIFREFDSSRPNKNGWPRRHFWSRQVARKVALIKVEQKSATITVASPEFLHRIKGGTVVPKRGKTLAIPANGQAYAQGGPRASGKQFTFLLLAQGNLVGALLNAWSQQIRVTKTGVKAGKERGMDVAYWLVRKVTHQPDPTVDPSGNSTLRQRIESAVCKAAESAIHRLSRLGR